jgi:hypothetical protein
MYVATAALKSVEDFPMMPEIEQSLEGLQRTLQNIIMPNLTDSFAQEQASIIVATLRHHLLLEKAAKRIDDDQVMYLLKVILKASGKCGVPQGGVLSPLLSNLYLNEVDELLESAREATRHDVWTGIEYARIADDLAVLVDGHVRRRWWRGEI